MSVFDALLKGIIIIVIVVVLFLYLLQSGFLNKLVYDNSINANVIRISKLLQNPSGYYGKSIQVTGTLARNNYAVYNLYNFAGGFVALNNVSSAQLIYGGNYTAFGLFGSAVSTAACTTQESNCTIQAESSTSNQCVTQVNCTNTYYYINVTSITKLP